MIKLLSLIQIMMIIIIAKVGINIYLGDSFYKLKIYDSAINIFD